MDGFLWYQRFTQGIKYRMGAIWKPNKGFSTRLLIKMFLKAESRRIEEKSEIRKHKWSTFVAYGVVIYMLSLQSAEGFLLNINEIRKTGQEIHRNIFG